MKTTVNVKTKSRKGRSSVSADKEMCVICGLPQRFLTQNYSPAEMIMYHPLSYCICNQLSEE